MKRTAAFFLGIVLLASSHLAFSQGLVVFNNNTATRITNCFDRLPQDRTIFVQLYYTPDLAAATDSSALASMMTAGVPKTLFQPGLFNGGTVTLSGIPSGAQVVLQLKAWPTNYPSFEEAVQAALGGLPVELSVSLPWVQTVSGPPSPPGIISQWGFRPILFPQCEPMRVPLTIKRVNNSTVIVNWPLGVPPALQVSDSTGTNWQSYTSGIFVQDHWEFQVPATNGVQLLRLAQ